ncbi:MAG TPA: nuclear transport factor 2 family protein [Gaiellaceae bacterium]|nr:nuclear transport factor 2 family protein [Gaiellaceae bacterium]
MAGDSTDAEVAALVQRVREAASAIIRGDARGYFTLLPHADDYTLMAPFGGEPRRGVETSEETLAGLAAYFQGGEAEVEVVQAYASSDLVVLAVIERQHGTVGGLAEQDLSLRVTLVFRRDAGGGDSCTATQTRLSTPIGEEELGALLRGERAG